MSLYRKALTAGIFGLASSFGTALSDGNLTAGEALAALGSTLLLVAAVYQIPNQAKG